MSQSTRRSRHRQVGVGQFVAVAHGGLWRLAAQPPVELSRTAMARLTMLEWHRDHGHDVSLTARHFGWSRPTDEPGDDTGRYDPRHLGRLEDRSSRPHRCRRPTWTSEQGRAVKRLREHRTRTVAGRNGCSTARIVVRGDAWFRQGPNPGEREPRLPSGLVKQVAKTK